MSIDITFTTVPLSHKDSNEEGSQYFSKGEKTPSESEISESSDKRYYFDSKTSTRVRKDMAIPYNALMRQARSHSLFKRVKSITAARKIADLEIEKLSEVKGKIKAIKKEASRRATIALIGATVLTGGLFAIVEGINILRDKFGQKVD